MSKVPAPGASRHSRSSYYMYESLTIVAKSVGALRRQRAGSAGRFSGPVQRAGSAGALGGRGPSGSDTRATTRSDRDRRAAESARSSWLCRKR